MTIDFAEELRTSVSLRIMGDLDFERISKQLDIIPSHTNRKGEKAGILDEVMEFDIWTLDSEWGDQIQKQFEWLIEQFDGKYEILKEIGGYAKIDIFCAITTPEQSGFSLSHEVLSIFHELKINLEVSLIA